MNAALACDGLTLQLGAFALGPVSITFDPGEYFVLMGPSGCGKTTLLRALAGVHRLRAGRITFGDEDLTDAPPHRRRIAYVAQTADLFPHLTVAENIRFGLRYLADRSEPEAAACRRVADLLGVAHLLGRRPATLSGGESKRVALARALAVRPRVLLLDEPLGMIDPQGRAAMLETLHRVHRETGVTVLHVTHDREEAWTLDARSAVMRDGRIAQVGRPDALFRRPASSFVARFAGGENVLPARFVRDGAAWTARTDVGPLPLADTPPGDAGFVQIRPEALTLAGDTEDRGAAFATATVLRVRDRGAFREVRLQVGDAATLVAHLAHAAVPPTEGASVALRLAEPPHPLPEDAP